MDKIELAQLRAKLLADASQEVTEFSDMNGSVYERRRVVRRKPLELNDFKQVAIMDLVRGLSNPGTVMARELKRELGL